MSLIAIIYGLVRISKRNRKARIGIDFFVVFGSVLMCIQNFSTDLSLSAIFGMVAVTELVQAIQQISQLRKNTTGDSK